VRVSLGLKREVRLRFDDVYCTYLFICLGPQLKVVATQSVGLDHVDVAECARRNIPVGYTPDVLTDAVAEATIALTLATARRYKEGSCNIV